MRYDFMSAFQNRMKIAGLYSRIVQNSGSRKDVWKDVTENDEQLNIIYAILLFIMDKTLKEEICTKEIIAEFLFNINNDCMHKNLDKDDCIALTDYIVNDVLLNDGRPMYFAGYNFENNTQQQINISYIKNKSVNVDPKTKRASYELSDDGYTLLLGTYEIEANIRIPVQEMIFRLHLNRQDYDHALADIQNIFNTIRQHMQRVQDATDRIRRNILEYNPDDYGLLITDSGKTMEETRNKFQAHRETVHSRFKEIEENNIDLSGMSDEDKEKLHKLKQIDSYLSRTLNAHQRILGTQLDMQEAFNEEVANIFRMNLVEQFSFEKEIYNRIIKNPTRLDALPDILAPLFKDTPKKIFNLFSALDYEQPDQEEEDGEGEFITMDFEKESEEEERKRQEKQAAFRGSIEAFLEEICSRDEPISLSDIVNNADEAKKTKLFPNITIFKYVILELRHMDDSEKNASGKQQGIRKMEDGWDLMFDSTLQGILQEHPEWEFTALYPELQTEKKIIIRDVPTRLGEVKDIRCDDIIFRVERG